MSTSRMSTSKMITPGLETGMSRPDSIYEDMWEGGELVYVRFRTACRVYRFSGLGFRGRDYSFGL